MEKILIANRGEIAIRAMRAADELGLRTVAVYSDADRDALHRVKADEAYQVGPRDRPLAGYLDVDELVRTAVAADADALYPGYGFLSESPALARACHEAGLTFVGPPAEVLSRAGDKVAARDAARAAGVPVLEASDPIVEGTDLRRSAERIGFPLFVKAAAGGGGRGLRLVESPDELQAAVDTAQREAQGAFGDPTVFLENAVLRPRHIEVQVLADATGDLIHLYERDCSIQRRYQKVLEIAPAPNLDPALRERLCEDALKFAEAVGYVNAGTVEFLVDRDGRHVFIEMNPRIQVEHTVTEEVTDVDLVASQLRIAAGESLADLGLSQEGIYTRGTALQCRITTEDPENGFRPDTGTITAYRSAAGAGIRLDVGSAYVGATVSPYFDPLLVKLTARGPELATAARRARRALREFRIRGVNTNVAFLEAVLDDPDLLAGEISTSFITERPQLTRATTGRDRTTRLLEFIGDVTVHRPHGQPQLTADPARKLPPAPTTPPPEGSRDELRRRGAAGFAAWLRERDAVAVTDTTMRDAHQSLLATRVRTLDLLTAAPHVAHRLSPALSLEVWGGATFDAALRFLHEDPWERLEALRGAIPNVCFQMLFRGENAVGYSRYPARVIGAFVEEATRAGIDIFRIFDALNDVERMRGAIAATIDAGAVAEGVMCYTGDAADPNEDRYTLDYYLRIAEQLDRAGAHVLCIKDMAGVLRAPAARLLVGALRERFPQPVHLHTHDTVGGQLGTYLAAIDAGVDAVDVAAAPLAGLTSQPSLSALIAATDAGPRPTGLDLDAQIELEPYWEAVRSSYAPFDAGLEAPSGAVYRHQIPGGQLSNLRQQAIGLGLGDRFEAIEEAYIVADRLLGGLIKVTPTSKVVGDLALFMLSRGLTAQEVETDPAGVDLPDSVIGFLHGELGEPPFGWPEPLRTRVLESRPVEPPPTLSDEDEASVADPATRREALTRLLFPQPASEQREVVEKYGEVWRLPTAVFLYGLDETEEVAIDLEPGKRVWIGLDAMGEPDERGIRSLWCRVNGQPRPVDVVDRTVGVTIASKERADESDPGHVAAPMTGVVTLAVQAGDELEAGDTVATIEAMKLESRVTATRSGTVTRIVASTGTHLEPGDLIAVIEA